MSLAGYIKSKTPWSVRRAIRRAKHDLFRGIDAKRSTKEVFTDIYLNNRWAEGDNSQRDSLPFNSGAGSGEKYAIPYSECVNQFIDENKLQRVVDLGCGDFRVGRRIARASVHYVGIDIVEPVVRANRNQFGNARVEFQCIDAITEELPNGDLCLVREVLQHLSNAQVATILGKLKKFRWVIVTEGQPGPPGTFRPNRDKTHGGDSRALWRSGIVLTEAPFNVANVQLLMSVPTASAVDDPLNQGRIDTFLIDNSVV